VYRRTKVMGPTPQDIADLVAFLPQLSAPGFNPIVDWGGGEKDEEGSFVMPWPNYHPVVGEFFRKAESECWTDHDYEPIEAGRMLEDKKLIEAADLSQIRTILTYCVRGERFCDGHLGEMIEKGYVQRILKRLSEIHGGAA
jgi:hypothetical protein